MVALAVATAVAHAPVVLGGETWDDVRYHAEVAPPRLAAAAAVQGGAWPAWWDGTGLGVPLAAEPSHGAIYPPGWSASTPRGLDLLLILHLAWAALGVAVWARTRVPPRTVAASDPGVLVAGVLIATSGLLASTALRGALPALAHLPWIGAAATWLVIASSRARREQAMAAAALGALIGLVGLTGELAALVDAVILAVAIAGRRRTWAALGLGLGGGLAIACAQWVPAVLHLPHAAGAQVAGLPLSRLLELIVPASFGATDPDRAVAALAGAAPWAPSLFVGAPLFALAAVRAPARRLLGALAAFGALALVTGRGGWPAVLGAPELHLTALVLVLAPSASTGVDALVAGDRRAARALALAAGCMAVALAAIAVLRARDPALAPALGRALLDGALGLACTVAAGVLAWRAAGKAAGRATPILLALLVLPGVGAMRSLAPTIARATVEDAPPWVRAADGLPRPLRAFRPTFLSGQVADPVEQVGDVIATLGGASAWRWGIAAARSTDLGRSRLHDRVWLAAAREGGALLDRFGISLAILPETLIVPRKLTALGRRGGWALVALPVAPVAGVLRGWRRAVDPEDALALMFAPGGGTGVLRGTVVLGEAGDARLDKGPPVPCTIDAWTEGDIALVCSPEVDGWATISSSAAPGWTVTVDGAPRGWVVADVLRRAVKIDAGMHRIAWTYATPGGTAGGVLAGLGVLALLGLVIAGRRA